jgi:nucleoside-diphosphate-sugar epimerase
VPRRTLIIGCGYVGLPLARELMTRGDEVAGWVRSEESAEELARHGLTRMIVGNVADENNWRGLREKFDAIVHCASSGGGGAAAYREVYLEGARQMNQHQPQARRIFVSSTSVYGQTDGAWVDESSPVNPDEETSRILVEAEREALGAGAMVVRAAGIYGPERAALFEKFRRGDAVIEGDGSRWINQVHQLDLVAAIAHLLDIGTPSEIYDASDNEPVMLRDFYAWCSETLKMPLPPHGPINPNRKRGATNKRVSNHKLRETGWVPRFPTFREGLAARER